MKGFVRTTALLVALLSSSLLMAQSNTDAQQLVADYLGAWSETNTDKRQEQLAQLFVEGGVHQSPASHSIGLDAISDEIAGFQQRFPGASVTSSNLMVTGNQIVFDFALVDGQGQPIATGVDYVLLDEVSGKIRKVVGFY